MSKIVGTPFSKFPVVFKINGTKYSSSYGGFPWGLWLRGLFQQMAVVLQQQIALQQPDLLPPRWRVLPPNGGNGRWGDQTPNQQKISRVHQLLLSIGLISIHQLVITGKNETRKYSAFIVPGGTTGNLVAVLETDVNNNATYVFRAEMAGWRTMAEQTKSFLLTHHPKEFVCKLHHSVNFDRNLLKLIKSL